MQISLACVCAHACVGWGRWVPEKGRRHWIPWILSYLTDAEKVWSTVLKEQQMFLATELSLQVRNKFCCDIISLPI